ncbi:MAG: hypothetical protein L3J69_06430 [Desulfobacula sp.]|nr:hypothetical protein [Desulfobacula sp.]
MMKLAEKKVMMKLNGSLSEYDPIKRSMPNTKKKALMRAMATWETHHRYFIKLNLYS